MDEIYALTEPGEIEEHENESLQPFVQSNAQRGLQANPRGRFVLGSGRSVQHRGRGRRPFIRNTSENHPYAMSIAPMNF